MDIDKARVVAYLDCYREWQGDRENKQLAKEVDVWWHALNVEEQHLAWTLLHIEKLLKEKGG